MVDFYIYIKNIYFIDFDKKIIENISTELK